MFTNELFPVAQFAAKSQKGDVLGGIDCGWDALRPSGITTADTAIALKFHLQQGDMKMFSKLLRCTISERVTDVLQHLVLKNTATGKEITDLLCFLVDGTVPNNMARHSDIGFLTFYLDRNFD